MNDKEYEELERRIEERNRIKAMAADLEESRKETMRNRQEENIRDGTSIEKAWGGFGEAPRKPKIAGDLFNAIQISNEG